jgi:ABC-type dipeptide/oligopeptide/nickel transport system ATPase component
MMVSLELVKNHLNLLGNDDDEYITTLIEAAESTLETELNISLCDISHDKFNIVKVCVCQLVAVMYQFREAASINELKSSYIFNYLKSLIHNYTINSFG